MSNCGGVHSLPCGLIRRKSWINQWRDITHARSSLTRGTVGLGSHGFISNQRYVQINSIWPTAAPFLFCPTLLLTPVGPLKINWVKYIFFSWCRNQESGPRKAQVTGSRGPCCKEHSGWLKKTGKLQIVETPPRGGGEPSCWLLRWMHAIPLCWRC